MRQLLQYPDLRLAQEIDALEKHAREDDPELGRFRAAVSYTHLTLPTIYSV